MKKTLHDLSRTAGTVLLVLFVALGLLGAEPLAAIGFSDYGLVDGRVKTPYANRFYGNDASNPYTVISTTSCVYPNAFNGCPATSSYFQAETPHDHDGDGNCDFATSVGSSSYTQYSSGSTCPNYHAYWVNTTWDSNDPFWVLDMNNETSAEAYNQHGPPSLSLPRAIPGQGLMGFHMANKSDGTKQARLRLDLAYNDRATSGEDEEYHNQLHGAAGIPYLQFGASKYRGNTGIIGYVRPDTSGPGYKPSHVKFTSTRRASNAGTAVYRFVAVAEWGGENRMVQLNLYETYTGETGRWTWNWPFPDHYFSPGADLIIIDRAEANSICGMGIPAATQWTPVSYDIDLTELYECADQIYGWQDTMFNYDIPVTGVFWALEGTGSTGALAVWLEDIEHSM